MTPAEPLSHAATAPAADPWRLLDIVAVDPDSCSFLEDHRVQGTPLLPTVVQLDLLAGTRPGRAVRLSSIVVGSPVLLAGTTARPLVVAGRPRADGRWELALHGADGALHLTAVIDSTPAHSVVDTVVDEIASPGARAGADAVYPPLFHGPAFQVLAGCRRDGDGLVSDPAPDRGPWRVPGHGGVLPTALLELVLQTCGVWELAETGTPMRPSTIDEVTVPAPRGRPPERPRVTVAARPGTGPDDRVFDGRAVDGHGVLLAEVTGYRPVRLGGSAPPGVDRLAAQLGPRRAPGHPTPTTPEGDRP